jgi:hemolysin activation/secretion protein
MSLKSGKNLLACIAEDFSMFVSNQSKLVIGIALAFSQNALAVVYPGAGAQMQQAQQAQLPNQEHLPPEIRIEASDANTSDVDNQTQVHVNALQFTGQTVFTADKLLDVTGFKPSSTLTLADLRAMAARITSFYNDRGYFVAHAYLPAQDISSGVVTIVVSEGRYGKIIVNNKSKLTNSIPTAILDNLESGAPITIAPVESSLLLLSDVPGVQVKSTLVPGTTVGTSDLIVDIEPDRLLSGSIDADNAGNRYTGEYRYGATLNLNNALGYGDVTSLRVMSTFDGLDYARGSYQMQFGKATVGAAYSWLEYELGKEFTFLQANGSAKIASIYASYPLQRSRLTNHNVMIGYDDARYIDRIDAVGLVTKKNAQIGMVSLYGDHRDSFGGGGYNAYSLTLRAGNLDIVTPEALALDQLTAKTNGGFGKLAFSAGRLQNVTENFTLYAGINGQFASKNLDVSEKMELGGMYGVRAYPEGEAYGDEGVIATLEARLQIPGTLGRMNAVGFIDAGTITLNKDPWGPGDNHRTLSAAGVGLTWSERDNFLARVYYARKLGNEPALSAPDADGRFWVQLVKYF